MNRKSLEVTIVVPGLFAFEQEEFSQLNSSLPKLGALSRLLSKAKSTQTGGLTFECVLGEMFGIDHEIPVAALTFLNDTKTHSDRFVLRTDPVYLKADRDHLILLGSENLNITNDEAQSIITEFKHLYADCDWHFEWGTSHRWYLSLNNKPNSAFTNIWEVFGKSIQQYLPTGQDAKKWHAILNEFQMLLHNHSVNMAREAQGQLPINSLWMWGGGELPSHCPDKAKQWCKVWGNDALTGGLARWSQIKHDCLPLSANEWIQSNPRGKQLLVLQDLRCLARTDFDAWCAALESIDKNWFEPLESYVKKGVIQQLNVETLNGKSYQISRSVFSVWWKKGGMWHKHA